MISQVELFLNREHYEEHLDEAAFLWSQWERALLAPDQVLSEVAEMEERLAARLDALVLAGTAAAERLLVPALECDEPERICSAAWALVEGGLPGGLQALLQQLETPASPAAFSALQRALEVVRQEALPPWLPSLLQSEKGALQALALGVSSLHGSHPAAGVVERLVHGEPEVAAAALRAAALLRVPLQRQVLQRLWDSSSPGVSDAAIELGLLLGYRGAWTACRQVVEARRAELRHPLLLLALGGAEEDLRRLIALLEQPATMPAALYALGFSGRRASAEACLSLLGDKQACALAAESFCAITGLELTGELLAEAEPEPEEPISLEEELEADLTPKPEDDLPRPDASAVIAWWKHNHQHFSTDTRYLRGETFTPAVLREALWTEPMRRRHALGLEVALRSRGALRLHTRAFSHHQLAALSAIRSAPVSLLARPFTEGLS